MHTISNCMEQYELLGHTVYWAEEAKHKRIYIVDSLQKGSEMGRLKYAGEYYH